MMEEAINIGLTCSTINIKNFYIILISSLDIDPLRHKYLGRLHRKKKNVAKS